jgi:integrase/recombinase XerD
MTALANVSNPAPIARTDADANDEQLVGMWLHGRSEHTVRAYRRATDAFRAFVGGKPLRTVTLGDLQGFADSLTGAASSRGQSVAAVKSLLSFAAKLGAVPFNVGAALRKPKGREGLADRILGESDVARMLALSSGRDHALVRVAYAGGFRVSELVGMRWADVADARDGGAFLTVLGKGGKTRTVRVSSATAKVLRELRADAPASAFVFAGRSAGLDPSQAWRIVRAAAARAGIDKPVSPHFMRHAHASHALDRGAKVTTVRDTLGHSSIAVTDRYAHARPEESSGLSLSV